jgi:hypothetical protein
VIVWIAFSAVPHFAASSDDAGWLVSYRSISIGMCPHPVTVYSVLHIRLGERVSNFPDLLCALRAAEEFGRDQLRAVVLEDAPGILTRTELSGVVDDVLLKVTFGDGGFVSEAFTEQLDALECLIGTDVRCAFANFTGTVYATEDGGFPLGDRVLGSP